MPTLRRLDGIERGQLLEFEVDGEKITAYEGETIAAALLAHGTKVFRHTRKNHSPRGIFCGMGLCNECIMTVDGEPNVRACQTYVRHGMKVSTQVGFGSVSSYLPETDYDDTENKSR